MQRSDRVGAWTNDLWYGPAGERPTASRESAFVQIELPGELGNAEFKPKDPTSFRPPKAGERGLLQGCFAVGELAIKSPPNQVGRGHLLEVDPPVHARECRRGGQGEIQACPVADDYS